MKMETRMLIGAVGMLSANVALAAVSAEEAKQLDGTTYTAWGAERAGNKEGTIPEYTGERVKPPTDFDPKEPLRMPDPFKDDKPLFTITAQNMAQYADKLTEAQKDIFKKYPDWRMNIYQTRRTAYYPKWVLDFTKKNATSCKTENNGLLISGCWGGIPFPFPKTGNEVMWNHGVRYQMPSWHGSISSYIVDQNGHVVLGATNEHDEFYSFHDPKRTAAALPNDLYYKLRWQDVAPARKAGGMYLFLFTLDSKSRVYQYIPGQRRVKLAPDLAYDTPTPGNGGVVTMDEGQLFFGSQDRFDFKLVGKTEKYIQYNNYKLSDYKVCPSEKLLTGKFMNPDCIRWELHRVWVVDAKLKPGFRHIMPHRVFYFDEDVFGAGTTDDYDAGGKLFRTSNSYYYQAYNSPNGGNYSDCSNVQDLQSGLYSPVCVLSNKGHGIIETPPALETFYSPESLAGEGVR